MISSDRGEGRSVGIGVVGVRVVMVVKDATNNKKKRNDRSVS